ncbi:uncharacterized protein LOC143252861 isoform X2 [Tachypleus tridentatus]|uniref:uncharacterized protein LOC143252861 isoform X2 n=1 Tax=Tachypleus tridentatus TaxID=6853 RepID=UPI003FD2460D
MANYTQLFYIFGSFLLVSGFRFVYETERGSTLTLICSNQAYKRAREEPVIWFSNLNEQVINSERTQIKYGGELVLTNIQFEDAGIYTCKNREGDYKHDVRVYVPAENLNCTRGYQRDVYRCYPTDMVLKVTFPWATKRTVVRYPWWMEELTLISICLIALCVLCCFCNVNEKARGKWKALKNRILGSCGVFAYTKLEDQELETKKITPSELDILEAVSMIPECEKAPTNKFNKRETNVVLKENQTEPTILQTINENHSVEKKPERAENVSKPASSPDKTELKTRVETTVNDEKPEETLKSDSLTTAETPASKEIKDVDCIQREVSSNIRPPSTRLFHNVDKIITVRLGSKPEYHQRNVFIVIENSENRNKFVIGRAPKSTPTCQLKRCKSEHKLIVQKPKKNNQIKHVDSPHKIVFTRDPKLEPKPKN